ncbi:Tigger transposable element-derived protein 1 [Smittium culicis]|uniref:Tigger transposable element-derived protein 1 n=1 Tax=Smittium culicis TaxID=133412 RepID=A0A1R1X4U1_9FUNG|nr:Tigger transposable element-derived protein 1 [Smittium culicis]
MSISEKIEVLNALQNENNVSKVEKMKGINESTLRYIIKNSEKIRKIDTISSSYSKDKTFYHRHEIISKMEKSLKEWIDLQLRKNSAATTASIKQKSLSIFQNIRETFPSEENVTFSASSGWFKNFKRREGLHNIKFTGEAASGDHIAAREFPNELNRIIKE